MAVKALLFDLDGTLSDADAVHLANWIEVLRPHGIDVDMLPRLKTWEFA